MIDRSTPRLALLALAALAGPLGAQSDPQDLSARVESLEAELARLSEQRAASPATDKHAVLAGLQLELYGYVKLDAAYDTARTSIGDYARWVESEELSADDDQLNITARQTRLGLRLAGPRGGALETGGRVEIDFYGGGAENKSIPMMRHAYLELAWPASRWSVLAGQTSDVISPLVPSTVNYTVAWWQGNIGYRRPQVRATKRLGAPGESELELTLAATRSITGYVTEFTPEGDSGADEGYPSAQGRVGLSVPVGQGRAATFGLSGHWGREEIDQDTSGSCEHAESWSVNLDAKVPLGPDVELQAELFSGANLAAYLGGIGQGLDADDAEIAASGGWLAGTWRVAPRWSLGLGWGIDDPEDGDVPAQGRTRNQLWFANVEHRLDDAARLAFELAWLDTDYRDQAAGDALRAQLAFLYAF